jgi:hypothetical protein
MIFRRIIFGINTHKKFLVQKNISWKINVPKTLSIKGLRVGKKTKKDEKMMIFLGGG